MNAAVLDAAGPIIACVLIMGIPIIAILVKHQQKMAVIMRSSAPQYDQHQIDALRRDVDLMRATLNQQTIMLDQIATQQRELSAALKADSSLEQRLTS